MNQRLRDYKVVSTSNLKSLLYSAAEMKLSVLVMNLVDCVAIKKDKFYWIFTKINNIKTILVIRNFFRIAKRY